MISEQNRDETRSQRAHSLPLNRIFGRNGVRPALIFWRFVFNDPTVVQDDEAARQISELLEATTRAFRTHSFRTTIAQEHGVGSCFTNITLGLCSSA